MISKYKQRKQVEAIGDRALKQMRFILEGIKSGRLAHEQTDWHCGMGQHCFGGWQIVFDIKRKSSKKQREKIMSTFSGHQNRIWNFLYGEIISHSMAQSGYLMQKWNLNNFEAGALFYQKATIETQEAVIRLLELGQRMKKHIDLDDSNIAGDVQVEKMMEWPQRGQLVTVITRSPEEQIQALYDADTSIFYEVNYLVKEILNPSSEVTFGPGHIEPKDTLEEGRYFTKRAIKRWSVFVTLA